MSEWVNRRMSGNGEPKNENNNDYCMCLCVFVRARMCNYGHGQTRTVLFVCDHCVLRSYGSVRCAHFQIVDLF